MVPDFAWPLISPLCLPSLLPMLWWVEVQQAVPCSKDCTWCSPAEREHKNGLLIAVLVKLCLHNNPNRAGALLHRLPCSSWISYPFNIFHLNINFPAARITTEYWCPSELLLLNCEPRSLKTWSFIINSKALQEPSTWLSSRFSPSKLDVIDHTIPHRIGCTSGHGTLGYMKNASEVRCVVRGFFLWSTS